ncbi:MAG: hypothetical protein GFH27_549287n40 [Chloroflexi bacterium AL-W]|nr:hypothetical protein [Chloroflexi bacterium AL-W]
MYERLTSENAAHFHAVLRWLTPLVSSFAIAYGLLGWAFGDQSMWMSGIIIAIVACIIGCGYVVNTIRGIQAWTAVWVSGGFLLSVPVLTLLQPFFVINYALVPVMIALLLLQYAPHGYTRLYMLVCAITSIIVASCGTLLPLVVPINTTLPDILIHGVQLSSFSATVGILLLLAGQFWHQLQQSVLQLDTMNSQLDSANETLRDMALRDPLTQLFNRRYVDEALELEIYRAQRNGISIGIMVIDLDHFKHVNDTYGHDMGDVLLQAIATLLEEHVRSGDVVARLGGEEFLMVLPGIPLPPLRQRAEAICAAVRALQIEHNGQKIANRSCSIGIASYPDHGDVGTTLIRAADQALYQAKAAGRDQVMVAKDEITQWNNEMLARWDIETVEH